MVSSAPPQFVTNTHTNCGKTSPRTRRLGDRFRQGVLWGVVCVVDLLELRKHLLEPREIGGVDLVERFVCLGVSAKSPRARSPHCKAPHRP